MEEGEEGCTRNCPDEVLRSSSRDVEGHAFPMGGTATAVDLSTGGEDWSWQDGTGTFDLNEAAGGDRTSDREQQHGFSCNDDRDRGRHDDRNRETEPDLPLDLRTEEVVDTDDDCLELPLYAGEGVHVTGTVSGQSVREEERIGDTGPGAGPHGAEGVSLAEDNSIFDSINVKKDPPRNWRKMGQKVKASVQTPPAGPFSRTDLQWESKTNQGCGKRRETKKATIPWNRLDDFLEGEMSGRQHPCTFVEVTRRCKTKQENRKQTRADSALMEIRYAV